MKFMFAQFTGVNVQQRDRYQQFEIDQAKEDFREQIADLYDKNLLLITDPMAGSSKYWNDIEDMLREFTEDYGAETIFFDTGNSVGAKTRSGQDARWNEYESIARDAEQFCQELNPAVIFSAQMDSNAVKRDDKTPQLGDVAGSKALTEKAATIVHLMRTDLYNRKDGIDYSELHCTKNRPMGTEMGTTPVRIKYDANFKRLYETDEQGPERMVLNIGGPSSSGDTFITPKEVTGVSKHPTLQMDPIDGMDI
jgi:replicative DNA helicase